MKRGLLFLIRCYQKGLSPLLLRRCRFYPSCSEYAWVAIDRMGVMKGLWYTLRRLARCHPFSPGGVNEVP